MSPRSLLWILGALTLSSPAAADPPSFLRSLPREQGRAALRATELKAKQLTQRGCVAANIIDYNEVLVATGEGSAIHGARAYVQRLVSAGVRPCVVSNKPARHLDEVKQKLARYGFPVDKMEFYLNPGMDGLRWKREGISSVLRKGYIVTAAFDNEPRNTELMKELLPTADIFRLNTGYWEGAPKRPADFGSGPIKVLQWFHHPDATR
jgi:hypothetical protein